MKLVALQGRMEVPIAKKFWNFQAASLWICIVFNILLRQVLYTLAIFSNAYWVMELNDNQQISNQVTCRLRITLFFISKIEVKDFSKEREMIFRGIIGKQECKLDCRVNDCYYYLYVTRHWFDIETDVWCEPLITSGD